MPPKRPAAAAAKVRSALRRPAAAEGERKGEESVPPGERFKKGETVELEQLPIGALHVGDLLVFEDCSYFGGPCKCAGRFRELCQAEGGSRLKIHFTGTTHPDLLAYATGIPDRSGEVHICPSGCVGEPHSPGLVHSKLVKLIQKAKEGKVDWELNLETETVDELEELRKKKAELEAALAEKEKQEERSKGDKRSRSKKRKRRRSKRRREEDSTSARDGKEKKEKSQKPKRRYGGRTVARKDLEAVYGGTGLDPRSRVRRRVMRYARRKTRKKASSSSTSEETSSSGKSRSSEEAMDMLKDMNKIRNLHRHGPGVLTSMGIARMKETVIELEGIWKEEDNSLPPVAMKYVRSTLVKSMSGGALKEAMTLGTVLDLMMMGRISEAADVAMQRLKAIEKVAQGSSWSSTEKLELVGSANPQISTRGELTAAAKEAKLDQQSKGPVSPYKGKGMTQEGKGKKGKGDEKGKGKKGSESDRAGKEKREKWWKRRKRWLWREGWEI